MVSLMMCACWTLAILLNQHASQPKVPPPPLQLFSTHQSAFAGIQAWPPHFGQEQWHSRLLSTFCKYLLSIIKYISKTILTSLVLTWCQYSLKFLFNHANKQTWRQWGLPYPWPVGMCQSQLKSESIGFAFQIRWIRIRIRICQQRFVTRPQLVQFNLDIRLLSTHWIHWTGTSLYAVIRRRRLYRIITRTALYWNEQ